MQSNLALNSAFLVRTEAAREALRELTGDIGLVMLISEGLEFSDVLLWDFFSYSTASPSDWRVILNLFRDPGEGVPRFDKIRHA